MGTSAGGIYGFNSSGTATNCYSTGSIGEKAGGIFGRSINNGVSVSNATNCYSRGNIGLEGGGIFGSGSLGIATNCYSTGTIGNYAGGIFGPGSQIGTIATNCYSTGSLLNSSSRTIAGITPYGPVTVTNCGSSNGWNDTTANLYLTGTSGAVGTRVWYSPAINSPYIATIVTMSTTLTSVLTPSDNYNSITPGSRTTLSSLESIILNSTLPAPIPTPITVIAPSNNNRLSEPLPSGSTYFAFNKNTVATYTINNTTDTIRCDGTGAQYFCLGGVTPGVLMFVGQTITMTRGRKLIVGYLGSLSLSPGPGPICFLGNAPVATPSGPRRIDSLKEGDLVLTETGKAVKIQRVKTMRCRPSPTTNPYIIRKGQYGATEELLISPRHKVATDNGNMIEARDLGLNQKEMKAPFTYYNIELPGWANMRVAGVEVESLAPAKAQLLTQEQFNAALSGITMTKETLKTIQRLCTRHPSGKVMVMGGPLKL
jgi:hypothetical protein